MAAVTPEIDVDTADAEVAAALRQAAERADQLDRMTWITARGRQVAAVVPVYAGAALGGDVPGQPRRPKPQRGKR